MIKLNELKDWKDGINQVVCGDCLDLMKIMESNYLDGIITDVPYNTGMSQKTSNGSTWLSHFFDDNYTEESYQSLVETCSREFYRLLKNDRYIYIYKLERIPKMV